MEEAIISKEKLWNKYFILLCLGVTFVGVSLQLVNSTLPLYIQDIGGQSSFTGVTMTGMTAAAMVTRFLVGRLSDKKGRRVMMLAGLAILLAATVTYAAIPSLIAIFIIRMVQGVGFSMFSNKSSAAVADVLPPKRLGEGIGYYGLGNSLSTAVGPSLALMILAGVYFERVFITAAFAVIVTGVMVYFCKYEKKKDPAETAREAVSNLPEAQEKGIWKFLEKGALRPASIQLCSSFAMSMILSFLIIFAKDKGISNPGMFFTFQAVAMLVARLSSGRIADRHGNLVVLIPASCMVIASCLILGFLVNDTLYLVAGALYGFGMGSYQPILNSMAMKSAPPSRRGAASTTFFLAGDIGLGVGSLVWGFVMDYLGYSFMFAGAACCIAIGIVLSIIFMRKERPAAAM